MRDGVVEPADLDELLAPLTWETRHLIGAEQLRRMKPGAYLVESMEALKSGVAREVVRVLSGDHPRSPVNEPTGRGPVG